MEIRRAIFFAFFVVVAVCLFVCLQKTFFKARKMMFNKISRFFSTGEADNDTNDDDDNGDDNNDDDNNDDDDIDDDSVGNLFFS